jgi:hypothetical protein
MKNKSNQQLITLRTSIIYSKISSMARLFTTFLFLFITSFSIGQQNAKADVIIKLNGEELKVKVTEITDTEVKFNYIGETVVYSLKKSEIFKINFASGRSEVYTKPPSAEPAPESAPTPEPNAPPSAPSGDSRNKVAILPFAFIQDGQKAVNEISEKVQNEVYAYMNKHSGGVYTYLEPRTVNALLIKSGVTSETVKGFTMDELCRLLGVEYIIEGIVTVNERNQTSYGSTNYNTNTKNNNKTSTPTNMKTTGSNYSTTTQNYETTMMLNVFNDKGSSLFSQEKKSAWSTKDSYRSTMEYLLKRTPLYSK